MSFILDALRKSEHARQQRTGPGLAEVPVVPARPRSNVWATAAVALLIVNLVGVGVLLVRRANKEPAPPEIPAAISPATSAAAQGSDSAPAAATAAAATRGAVAAPPAPAVAPPVAAGRNPLAEEVDGNAAGQDPTLAVGAANVPAGPPAVTTQASGSTRRGSVVYAPLPEGADVPYTPPAPVASAAAPGSDALPSADDIAARGGMPALHLDLHVYSSAQQQRFIFVNSRKYREGETLQEGPVIEQITADGAVLSYGGSRFKLTSD